jgi:hypothetical protein
MAVSVYVFDEDGRISKNITFAVVPRIGEKIHLEEHGPLYTVKDIVHREVAGNIQIGMKIDWKN